MAEYFNLSIDYEEKVDDLEDLKREIKEIDDIEEIDEAKALGVGLCLLITVVAPLLVEVIIKKAPPAIKKLKEHIKFILEKSKKKSDKAKLTLQYKALVIPIKNEDDIDLGVDRLINYD